MPNYRIPSNADNDANGIWKMNDVKKAREGGEWPDTYVPYVPAQYYIRSMTGSPVTITDGTTTNSGVGSTGGATWTYNYLWFNCDAIGFSHQTTGSQTSYKLNKISIGVGHGSWMGNYNDAHWIVRIYTGLGTMWGSAKIYDSDRITTPQGSITTGTEFASTAYGGVGGYSFMMLDLPDGVGLADPLPTLSWNTAYTVAMHWDDYSSTGYSFQNRATSRQITLTNGDTVTQNHFNISSFSDISPFGATNGTSGSPGGNGQFPVLGYIM